MHDDEIIMVFTHVPDHDCATRMAEALINAQLAACVNISSPCTSIYTWNNQLERTREIPMVIKTHRRLYSKIESMMLSMHPYELPEIIALHVSGGLPQYLQWVNAQISPQEHHD
jgi:periplasmic divalent cation tolerance protein